MTSENTAETPETDALVGIDSLGELLAATEPSGEPDTEDSDASGSSDAELRKFNDLAGRLGVDLDDLYKLEVSQAEDGTPVTVESLKDFYAQQDTVKLRELEFEERRTQQEAQLMQAQEELRELMAAMPPNAIQPDVLQKLRQKHETQVTLEKRKTLEVIPEWNDEQTRTREVSGMVEHLSQYGYPLNHLERITDHRQLKYIRDNWQREQRIRSALEKVRAGKPNPTTGQKPAKSAPTKTPVMGVAGKDSRNTLEALFKNL